MSLPKRPATRACQMLSHRLATVSDQDFLVQPLWLRRANRRQMTAWLGPIVCNRRTAAPIRRNRREPTLKWFAIW